MKQFKCENLAIKELVTGWIAYYYGNNILEGLLKNEMLFALEFERKKS